MPSAEPPFDELVRRHHAAVYASAWRILRHEADAQDVAQEVFLEVLGDPARFATAEDPGRVLRWLAAKKALAHRRGDRSRRGREDRHAMERAEGTWDATVEEGEVRGLVMRLVAALPEELRDALVLRFQEGMTYAAIAEAAACSEPTAHERVRRGLERLRGRMARAGCAGVAPVLPELLAREELVASPAGLEARLLGLAAAGSAAKLAAPVKLALAAALLFGLSSAGALLLGRLDEPSRSPAAGLQPVHLAAAPGPGELTEMPDPAGRLRAAEAEPGRPRLAPPAPGLPGVGLAGQTPAPEHPLGRIHGRVVDERRAALAGAEVIARSLARQGKLARFEVGGETGPDGRFALEVPVPRAEGELYRLWIRHPERVTHWSDELLVRADETRELDELELLRNSEDHAGEWSLVAHVVGEDGVPVRRVSISIVRRLRAPGGGWSDAVEARGLTDDAGRVQLAGTHLGEKLALVEAHGQGYRAGRFELAIDRPGHAEHTFVMSRGLSIGGRIRLVEGGPLPDDVQVHAVGADPNAWIFAELTGDGRFELRGLDERDYRVRVDADGYSSAERSVAAGSEELDLALKRRDDPRDVGDHMAEIHGRLVDSESGAPVAADFWAVEEVWLPPGERDLPAADLHALHRQGSMAQRAAFGPIPEDSDRFHLVGLRSASYLVVAHVKGYAPALGGPFHLAEGQVVSEVVLRLEQGATVSGRVLDAEGRPVAQAFVWLGPRHDAGDRLNGLDEMLRREDARSLPGCVRTDAAGRFRYERLPSGLSYSSGALHADFRPVLGPALELGAKETREGLELRFGARR